MSSVSVTVEEANQIAREMQAREIRASSIKKMAIGVLSILAALTVAVGSATLWNYSSSHESTDDAYVDGNVTQISSRINGTVAKVLVSDNQYVKAGQAIVMLDSRDLDVKVAQAKAALEKAQRQAQEDAASVSVTASTAGAQQISAASDKMHAAAVIDDSKSTLASAQSALGIEQGKLLSLQAQQKQNALDLQRYTNLLSQGAIARQQFEQTKTQNDVAVAQVAAETSAVAQAKALVSKASADLQQAYSEQKKTGADELTVQSDREQTTAKQYQTKVSEAAVDQAKADLQNAKLQDSYTTIVAPVSGRIGKKAVQPGEQIQSGQQLLSLIPDQTWVTANFKETQLSGIRQHEAVDITLDAFPNHHFKGYIDSVAPGSGNEFALLPADNATGNFTKVVQRVPIKITFDEKSLDGYKQLVIPGLSAQVNVSLKTI
jgi:membrane fusion protein (multidrug efflux system)